MLTSILGLIYFLFALGIIVLVHELGHLYFAKKNDVYCHEFSVGMGPKIKTFYTDKDGTPYNLRAIPLGGYVMMAGEDSGNEKDDEVPSDKKLNNKKPWAKTKILFAGSLMNFILCITIILGISLFGGIATNSTTVQVVSDAPLSQNISDEEITITKINDKSVNTFEEVVAEVNESKDDVEITYQIDTKSENTTVTKNENGQIGIAQTKERFRPIKSIVNAVKTTLMLVASIFVSLALLFSDKFGVSDLAGPVGIYDMSSNVLSMGISAALMWIAYLSLNIGLMNLLPIPALDGGRLVFVLIEAITKKPVSKRVENFLIIASVFLLLALFVFVTFNDIMRLFS